MFCSPALLALLALSTSATTATSPDVEKPLSEKTRKDYVELPRRIEAVGEEISRNLQPKPADMGPPPQMISVLTTDQQQRLAALCREAAQLYDTALSEARAYVRHSDKELPRCSSNIQKYTEQRPDYEAAIAAFEALPLNTFKERFIGAARANALQLKVLLTVGRPVNLLSCAIEAIDAKRIDQLSRASDLGSEP